MTVEVDIKEIKQLLGQLDKKLEALADEQEVRGVMAASERSLKDFLAKEPDLYSRSDLKVVYK